ncbi:MAG: NAD-dependent epimerase/dehydratase family protein [Elusimicrobia bacterium]|nr:NAD-dependent epimerase/dehydratase family protein [Elusimicrobiota bacterium]
MKVLVTGGAGFIGSKLAQRLCDDGHEVSVVDNLSTGSRDNVPKAAEFIKLDLASPSFEKKLPAGPFDAVCHLAAQSSGEISSEDPGYDLRANAGSTVGLARWCLRQGPPRFLYASSMAVYGDLETLPARESSPCAPLSPYGVSKLASEHFLRIAGREGLKSTSLRMFSVYGPGQNMGNLKQGMASIYLAYILRGLEVPVKGSLDRFRDFVYVDDVVDGWVAALGKPETLSLVYNLGSGKQTTVRQLLGALLRATGKPDAYPIAEKAPTPGDQFGLYADITRARAELGWQPKTALEDGLKAMAEWAGAATPGGRKR